MEINKIIEKIESKQNHLVNKVQVLKEYTTMKKEYLINIRNHSP